MFKSFQIQVLAILSFILCFTAAQSILPDPSTCADSNVTFDGCKILEAKSAECGSISVDDQTELIACFCTQEVYSSIINCKAEIRTCQRSDSGDATYDSILSEWESACLSKITFTPTSPSNPPSSSNLSSPSESSNPSNPSKSSPLPTAKPTTTTFPTLPSCQHVYTACASWSSQGALCSAQFTVSSEYYACQCKPEVLVQASACQVGAAECLGEVLSSETLYENQFCGSFTQAGSGTASSVRDTLTTSAGGGGVNSGAATTAFTPSTRSASAVVATTTSTAFASSPRAEKKKVWAVGLLAMFPGWYL
ncbi:hypothetical protein ACEPPN_014346 [Leptodophora sp. 'Broadleaf-Isolate-01']